jgi:hypothetical protein
VSPDNEVGSRFRAAHHVRRPFVDPVKTPDDRIRKGDSRPTCQTAKAVGLGLPQMFVPSKAREMGWSPTAMS